MLTRCCLAMSLLALAMPATAQDAEAARRILERAPLIDGNTATLPDDAPQ